jgi:lipopolysaccharide biosynthesis protein
MSKHTIHDWLPRALIVAHYDPDGVIDPHFLYSLAAYRRAFAHITLVSVSSDRLPNKCAHLADTFIARENVGYDFFSWKVGFNALKNKNQYFEIVFANDSIYGPLFDIEQALLSPRIKDADFWSVTSSFEVSWHLQSFFFAMRHRLVLSGRSQAYWDSIDALRDRGEVINNNEIPMARTFREQGWKIASLFTPTSSHSQWNLIRPGIDARQLLSSAKFIYGNCRPRLYNPMHHLWYSTINAGVPFVKVELLRHNPLQLPIEPVRDYLAHKTRYPLSLIDAHIQRTRK